MADDQITIDPEFDPRSGREDRPSIGRFWIGVAAAAAAFAFGWLLGSPESIEPEAAEKAPQASTAPGVETTSTTVTRGAPAVSSRELASLDTSLSRAVPGFTDTIVMLTTPEHRLNVMQWYPSEPMTEVVLSLDRDESGWIGGRPIGLDASGSWFAQVLAGEVLTVHPIPDAAEELPGREAVDLDVISVAWHDTEPGQLAWLACSRNRTGTSILSTLDFSDGSVEPRVTRLIEHGCERVWLDRWGDSGASIAVEPMDDGTSDNIIIDADGTETSIESGSWILAEGPDGTTLRTEVDPVQQPVSAFLLSPDGQRRDPVPGLADDEQPTDASWSPDDAHLALIIARDIDGPNALLRVVDLATGAVTMEAAEEGSVPITMVWSGDGRFLLYEFWDFEEDSGALGFYDTATDTTAIVPLSEIVDEIRVRDPAAVPFSGYDDLLFDVDRSTIDVADIGPSSGEAGPYWDGDDSLDTITIRLPLGERTALPDNARLDFLHTACEGTHCFRDAVVVDPDDSSRASGVWIAGVPFHIRHGFVNDAAGPLDEDFDVVVSVTRRDGPTLEDGTFEINHAYLFSTDYVLRGTAAECGSGYWDQTVLQTCEWFVHDFPDGLPPGRYDIWAMWLAPCRAWQDLGLSETCDDPALVTSMFAGSVNMPFGGAGYRG